MGITANTHPIAVPTVERSGMGCFCKQSVAALKDALRTTAHSEPEQHEPGESEQGRLVSALATWLSARWLPAPPWNPDPEWLDLAIPDPPMPATSFSVISGLVQAQAACLEELGVDVTQPDQQAKLARIVRTMNRRLPELEEVLQDDADWDSLAAQNDQIDTVAKAVRQGVFAPWADDRSEHDVPLGPWRPLLTKVKAIAPLLAILRSLDIDPADQDAPALLATQLRPLRGVKLPPIDAPLVSHGLIARLHALLRLQRSTGLNPRTVRFSQFQQAVQDKLDDTAAALPPELRTVEDDVRERSPNPSMLLTRDIVEQIQLLQPQTVAQFNWSVPPFEELDLLTTAAPVATLVSQLKRLGLPPVRSTPCGGTCDAGSLRNTPAAATGLPDTGTGAAPAA